MRSNSKNSDTFSDNKQESSARHYSEGLPASKEVPTNDMVNGPSCMFSARYYISGFIGAFAGITSGFVANDYKVIPIGAGVALLLSGSISIGDPNSPLISAEQVGFMVFSSAVQAMTMQMIYQYADATTPGFVLDAITLAGPVTCGMIGPSLTKAVRSLSSSIYSLWQQSRSWPSNAASAHEQVMQRFSIGK